MWKPPRPGFSAQPGPLWVTSGVVPVGRREVTAHTPADFLCQGEERGLPSRTWSFHRVNGFWDCRCTWENGTAIFFFPNWYLNLLLTIPRYRDFYSFFPNILVWQILNSQKVEGPVWTLLYLSPRFNNFVSIAFVSIWVCVSACLLEPYVHAFVFLYCFFSWLNLSKASCKHCDTSPVWERETTPLRMERIYSHDLMRHKVITR